jgi:hypothetical protein
MAPATPTGIPIHHAALLGGCPSDEVSMAARLITAAAPVAYIRNEDAAAP